MREIIIRNIDNAPNGKEFFAGISGNFKNFGQTLCEVNGIRLDCANDEVIEVGLAVASGAMDYEALLAWVRAHRA